MKSRKTKPRAAKSVIKHHSGLAAKAKPRAATAEQAQRRKAILMLNDIEKRAIASFARAQDLLNNTNRPRH